MCLGTPKVKNFLLANPLMGDPYPKGLDFMSVHSDFLFDNKFIAIIIDNKFIVKKETPCESKPEIQSEGTISL